MKRRAAIVALALALSAARGRPAEASETDREGREGSGKLVQGAKGFGLHSPRGRTIYRAEETFEDIVDSRRRIFVMEAQAGYGPEGNLGLVFGWMPKALHGVEFYGGAGVEINPAVHVSGAVRFLFNIRGYRPYVGVGYFYKDLFVTDVYAHNAFVEAGYSWKVGPTYHVTFGIGLARVLYTGVRAGSVLRGPDVDAASLERQIDDVLPYRPIVALRFSRAF